MQVASRRPREAYPSVPYPPSDDEIAMEMERLLVGNWSPYVTQNKHSSFSGAIPAGSTCLVHMNLSTWVIFVRFDFTGRNMRLVHEVFTVQPRIEYWYWPGLEEERTARLVRETRLRRVTGGCQDKLKPY